MKIQTKILLVLLFILINVSTYYISKLNSETIIDVVLKDNTEMLNAHYKVLLETQKKMANATYKSTIEIDRVLEIIRLANSASTSEKNTLRDELHSSLQKKYQILKEAGVLQYQFLLSNNESFYRAHKPSKFGDDLTNVREDFKYTNKTKKQIRAFTQGRTTHAFRNTFPLFDKDNNHIGAMEVSFSSDSFQWYLNYISGIHSHLIVNKSIFDEKTWQRDDLDLKYEQGSEHQDYMITLGEIHSKEKCVTENSKKLSKVRQEIDAKILTGKAFSLYVSHYDRIEAISFIPVLGMNKTPLAWLVSYDKNMLIQSTLQNVLIVRTVIFFLSLVLVYFIFKQISEKQLLDDILNSSDNPIFLTDFKNVLLSNYAFKGVVNNSFHDNVIKLFMNVDGYLHKGLQREGEDFLSLLSRTLPEDRVVSIIDMHSNTRAFKISVSKIDNNFKCLITLSDITEMKEQHAITTKKAYMDGLTHVYNRNKFDEILEEELKNVKRYDFPLSIALLDIDKFKNFNDTYGHLIGDEVLVTMAQTLNHNIRETDVFARWGGEEFVILFKNTSVNIAKEVSEKLKDKIEENEHPTAGKITASFGVTEYRNEDTSESIFKRCDEALYIAKENGRNRVESL